MRAVKVTVELTAPTYSYRTHNRQCSEILQHRPNMLPVGLWRVSNEARKDFLEGIDLQEEKSPEEMPNVRGRPEAEEMLVIERVQNAAGDEWEMKGA